MFENEDLENLFYAKMYENSLLTYELQGESKRETEEDNIEYKKGPIIACLDTSGSMNGTPLKKARALLLAISKILKKEDRKLYIILFGSVGEILELNIENSENNIEVFNFLNQNFNGGTDFDTPLKRAVEIIEEVKYYNKADILFISDGICELSNSGKEFLKNIFLVFLPLRCPTMYTLSLCCGTPKFLELSTFHSASYPSSSIAESIV